MASEMRRAAQALVARRGETFASRYPLDISRTRLGTELERAHVAESERFRVSWRDEGGDTFLDAQFHPSSTTQRFLQLASFAMLLLVAGSAWALLSAGEERSARFLLPLATVLAILGFPLVALALASHREAEEARIGKAIRRALLDVEDNR